MSILKRLAAKALPGRVLLRGPSRGANSLALTFDDGPHPENTPALLDEFARAGIQVTFFLIGRQAERYPDITRRILEAGHQVANHGYSHLNARKVSTRTYVADIDQGHDVLEQVLGTRLERYARPPFGILTLPSLAALLRGGHRIVLWSVDSLDYSIDSPSALVQRVQSYGFTSGDIVLAHDDYKHTVAAMGSMIASLKSRHFRLRTVSGLCC